VSASVIGANYYWGYEPNVVTWATTGTNGNAELLTPAAPLQVDAWKWVPTSGTTYPSPQAEGSGQAVNGTIIAVPIYVGLAGSTVVVPPQTSAVITLLLQQANYWVTPGVVTAIGAPSTSNYFPGPGSIPSSVYEQQGNPNIPDAVPEFSTIFALTVLVATSAIAFYKLRKLK
jgi:hypothetical protein